MILLTKVLSRFMYLNCLHADSVGHSNVSADTVFGACLGAMLKKIICSQIITNFAHFTLRFTEQTTFWHFLSCKFDSSKLLVSTGIYQQQLLGLKSRNGGQYRLRYDHVNPLLSS
jgi:hypothetical protein